MSLNSQKKKSNATWGNHVCALCLHKSKRAPHGGAKPHTIHRVCRARTLLGHFFSNVDDHANLRPTRLVLHGARKLGNVNSKCALPQQVLCWILEIDTKTPILFLSKPLTQALVDLHLVLIAILTILHIF